VVVTVSPVPNVVALPASQTICSGATTGIALSTTNGVAGATYSWTRVDAGVSGVLVGSGAAINETLTATGSVAGTATYTITPAAGGCNGTPITVIVTVNPLPDVVAAPASETICSGTTSNINLSTSNGVAGATYSWTVVQSNVSGATSGFGTSINQTLTATTSSAGTATYTITPAANGCTGTPINVVVTVSPVPNVVALPASQTICSGATTGIALSTTNGVAGATYSWTRVDAGVSGVLVGSGAAINETLTATGSVAGTATYTITPAAGGCNGTPITVIVTVNPLPDVVAAPASETICSGTTSNINLSTSNGVAGATYSWTVVQSSVSGATSGFGSSINQTLTAITSSAGTATYTITPSANGCTGTPINVVVTVSPKPIITNTALQLLTTICSNNILNFTPVSTTDPATIYSWTSVVSGSTFTGVLASGTGTITDTPVNTGNTVGYVTYTITPEVAGCFGNPVNYIVTVFPTPTADGSDIIICSGQNAVVLINSLPNNVAGTTFSWVAVPSANVLGAANGNGSTISQTLSVTDFTTGTVVYQITPSANGCAGAVKNITITINPLPTADAGVDYQVCEPTVIPLSGLIGGAATSGTWTIVTGAGSISASTVVGNTVTANYMVNPLDIATTIVLKLESNDPDLGEPCTVASDLLSIQINRRPTVIAPADFVVCEPANLLASPISLSGTIGGSATTGLWSIVSGAGTLGASNLVGSLVNTQYTIDASDIGTTITLRLTTNDPDGPGGPCTEEFEDIDITINQAAVVSAGPDLQLCRDTPSILLQGSHSGAPTTLAWSGGLGLFSDPTLAQPFYSFNDPTEVNTTVVLTLTALDPDGLGPCTAVADQMNLKINPLPVVVYTGLPPGAPSSLAENGPPITLTGNLAGGAFTILPTSSVIGSTFINVVDRAVFDPSAADLGSNFIKYTYTDGNGCTNFDEQEVFINPVTTIDFAVQGAVLNGSGEFELCSDLGLVKLLGFPVPADGFPPETQFTSEGPNAANMTIVKIGPDYFIQTSGLVSDSYRIRYTFKNQFNAITFRERTINFFGSPVSLFSSSNNCIVSDVVFTDNSIINPSPFPAAITSWQWAFGDNTFSTDQNPSKRYTTSGTFIVSLKVTTSQGCSSTSTPYVLRVGDVPIVDFSWSAICNNDNTNFQDQTTKVVGSVPPGISVITGYTWDFGDGDVLPSGVGAIPVGTHGGRTFGTYKDPQHKYVSNGTYSSTLLVDTNDGCSNSNTQNVFILPYNTVAPVAGAEYLEGFESTDGGWIAEAFNTTNSTPTNIVLSDTSWIWGMPAGAGGTINTAASGSNAWWTGKNANTYFSNENSTVNGPCFDLTQLKLPMVALDYFSDTEKNLDGSVLQYSIDGGLSWRIVGPPEGQSNRDEGINWFNGVGILSNPGSQPIGNYGWTDKQSEWKNARFNLDMIPAVNRAQVRLRIAFSSNDGNAPAPPAFDGFAFDNFFVGEKARHVLVEHFTTSTLTASTNADTYLNGLYQQQITDRGTSDFQDIQYHVNFSGTDPLNKDNPTDPAARALYFGASQPPFTIMDGLLTPGKFTGSTYELNKVEIDRRALVEPIFSLSLKDTTSIDDTHISVRMFITAKQDFASPVIVNVALVEKDVNGFKNVLRKNLFGSDGKTISLGFIQNQTNKSALVFNVPIDVPISNPNGLLLIGYVQDKNTKEIYQSIVIDGPVKNGDPVVGIEDELPLIATLNNIQMFPNPANNQFTFGIPADVYPGSQWQIIDQRGVTVLEGNFEGAVNGLKEVNVAELANAVYFVVMTGPKGVIVRKKLMVMNRN
jgi:PKD repeat protein